MSVTVTVRRLQRETSAVLREAEAGEHPIVVTRGDEEIAMIVPLDGAQRRWRRWVRELGGDPDDPGWRRDPEARPLPVAGPPLSEHLAEIRGTER